MIGHAVAPRPEPSRGPSRRSAGGRRSANRSARPAERAARLHLDAENADLRSRNAELAALNARLEHLAREMKRARFGPRSEKLSPDQLELAFEDLEAAIAEAQETHDVSASARAKTRPPRQTRTSRALPKDLPREERVIEPESLTCRCGCGDMVRIGEDRSERLDITPAQFRVLVTVRPRYACPKGRAGVVQGEPSCAIGSRTMASAPPALIEGGLPTEATIAHLLVSKYSEHLPLYRQAQVMARHEGRDARTGTEGGNADCKRAPPLRSRFHRSVPLPQRLRRHRETPRPWRDLGENRARKGQMAGSLRTSNLRPASAGACPATTWSGPVPPHA